MTEKTTRRGIVAGALALLGGAGLGAAATARATDERSHSTLRLHVPRLAVGNPDATPGMPSRAWRLEGAGELVSSEGAVGSFSSVVLPGHSGGVELHTFELDGGSLLGMGRAGGFAIVGGTGRFARAAGTYTVEHRPLERGGDGSADFVIDLSA